MKDSKWLEVKIKDKERFTEILGELRKLPEHSDVITAYGSGPEALDSYGVLGEFAEAIYTEEILDESDLANVYHQLFSIDFQNSYEGIDTFYDNFYEENNYDQVTRACQWLKDNDFSIIATKIEAGYKDDEKRKEMADWIDNNTDTIYSAYRKIMFMFEEKYLP